MQGPGTLTLSKADLIRAVEYWLNAQQLHEPVVVEDVQQHSAKSRTPTAMWEKFWIFTEGSSGRQCRGMRSDRSQRSAFTQ